MNFNFFKVLIILIFFSSCKEKSDVNFSNLYNKVDSVYSGVNFSNDLVDNSEMNIVEYLYFYNGGGVALGDINNDGLDDIYLTANQKSDQLYLNLGDLKFKNISNNLGIENQSSWSTGVSMADVNGDGWLDIYVSKVGKFKTLDSHNLLYINQRDGTFRELSKKFGLDFSGFSTQAAFFDYDRDGDLDMYLLNHNIHTPRNYTDSSKRFENDSLAGDKFFENRLNEKEGRFVDVTADVGIFSSFLGYGLAITTADINNDGWTDIYVGNDFHENDYVYINQKNKTFKESGQEYLSNNSRFTMGVDIADMNNDMLYDIFTLDMMPFYNDVFLKSGGEDSDQVYKIKNSFGYGDQYARNNFHLNRGNSKFSDIALYTETYATDWSWSVLLEDLDNDGMNDIFITNGIFKRPNDLDYINYASNIDYRSFETSNNNDLYKKLIDKMPTLMIPNIIFRNQGNLNFKKESKSVGMEKSYSNGAAYSDLDNDGDIDLVINNINQEVFILENLTDGKNNSVQIILSNNDNNYSSIGAKVNLYLKDKKLTKQLNPVKGFQSSSSYKINFGIESNSKVDSLSVIWPDGSTQTNFNIPINQLTTIKKKKSIVKKEFRKDIVSDPEKFDIHIENSTFDYDREILIPELLSTEGPALVKADFNGDNFDDLYIGGATDQSGKIYIANSKGEFKLKDIPIFKKDLMFEDVDASEIDFDNDGDLDLYVVSGGSEFLESDLRLSDRIYINDGKANFSKYPVRLPAYNGGAIAVSDFNNDGFDDIFLGSRSIPGSYGLSPFSFILLNNKRGGFGILEKFRIGMVTDAKWIDINQDKFLDLVIVGDWMPVTILINQGNETFKNETNKYGLKNTSGMWNSITTHDIDNNGKDDLIIGNAGENLKFKASKDSPIEVFIKDFDNNGRLDPIIFYNFLGNFVPFASKDKLDKQIPELKKKFTNYKSFSEVKSFYDLFEISRDSLVEYKKIQELRSMIFLNIKDSLHQIPLPKEAQLSPIQDILITGNNQKTLYFVGNYNNYVNELGKNNSNVGGKYKIKENLKFDEFEILNLPNQLNTRKIIEVGSTELLIISNNDFSYLIKK